MCTYLRRYSTPTWSLFVFCVCVCVFFFCRLCVVDFLLDIILALLLPRLLCFFPVCVLVCQSCAVIALSPDLHFGPWKNMFLPESQIPAKEQWSSSSIFSIWLPRSEHVFRWVIWLQSPSMLTCRLPRKDPGRRTASNCRFFSRKIMVNWKNNCPGSWVACDLLEEKQSMETCHMTPKNVGRSKC